MSVAAVVVLYLSWCALPSVHSEAEVKQVLSSQQQAFEEDQKVSKDLALNAFLDPQFAPYWGRKSVEMRPNSPVADTVSAMREYSILGAAKDPQTARLWQRKDGALRKAAADFAVLNSSLQKVLARPYFVIPNSQVPSIDSETANFLAQRNLAQALSAYAEVQIADGKPEVALGTALEILSLAKLVVSQKSHNLIGIMVASALQTTGQETLAAVLQSSNRWSPTSLHQALAGLESTFVSPDLALESLECELWLAQNYFRAKPDTALGKIPGLWSREWRLYQNDYFPAIQAMRAHQPVNLAWVSQFSVMNWLLGQHSWVSGTVFPNFNRISGLLELGRQRRDFLHLYAELLLQQAEGKLPSSLDPKSLGRLVPGRVSYLNAKGQPQLTYEIDPVLARQLPGVPPAGRSSAAWQTLMQPHWALPVSL